MSTYRDIAREGLWTNNPGLVQLLGLCPLLAVTGTTINGLGLGIATTIVLIGSNLAVSFIRHAVHPEIRIPVFVMIIASLVTAVELAMNAFFHDLYRVLGIFIPLIVTNCTIIGRAEAFASRNPVPRAFVDGLAMGLGFTAVLVVLGAMRELLGQGTLLAGAEMMFGAAVDLTLQPIPAYDGLLLAVLPPGAFIGLGLLVAAKNWIDARQQRASASSAKEARA
ncbi:electron transport complex subunit E [Gammaproteobacteria bacterium AB-CW1]|uniref:Ion-translocating oxidoreductase complex subunit E n=1 Tax=Natronospira elongata TaxID=3110268 RepID=A0AAP6JD66_9GAMM|nr:electron transport complex subunit E [Gammaproteobacteria bacterium AB-CW1]